jgi:hypothetical protein
LFAVGGCASTALTNSTGAVKSDTTATTACTPAQTVASLKYEQALVLKEVGQFRVLKNAEDLAELGFPNMYTGAMYDMLPHMYNSLKGMGFTIVNLGLPRDQEPVAGDPTFLLYAPNPKDKDVTDPSKPDFPYTLVGWGYTGLYDPGKTPTFPTDPGLKCIKPTQWVIHERGVHPANNWQFVPVPPKESWHGESAGQTMPTAAECHCSVGLPHTRLWDLHFFLGSNGIPTVSMLNPGKPIPGFNTDPGVGFFYPAKPPAT